MPKQISMAIPVYGGEFGEAEANRLLWRAGFGPKEGESARWAEKGLTKSVDSLLDPPKAKLKGPGPRDEDGNAIAPNDIWGHDVLWWLDKMVRSNQPLVERMALNWHDWFATGDVGHAKFSLAQAKLLRKRALGSFSGLLTDITTDRAMLVWLSGLSNSKYSPNENYARELMELFTLGVSEAGYPYSEDDVREQARALTGWVADWDEDLGLVNFRFDKSVHDRGSKTIFDQTGTFDWEDSLRLCLEHEAHAGFFVDKLWSYFIPDAIPADTRAELITSYRSGYRVKPILRAILKHPLFYEGSTMVKPPVVLIAGLLRGRKRFVDEDSWAWVSDLAGQRLFRPPNVAGWDETRWLDTSTFRGRWMIASNITGDNEVDHDNYPENETPQEAVNKALGYWGNPQISQATRTALIQFGTTVESAIVGDWQESSYRGVRQSALRVLVATSPDLQTC